jgi:dCMP deaminase
MIPDKVKVETFLMIAHTLGGLSTCDRAAIGAVITRQGRCIAWGYNGAPPGLPHCSQNNHGWDTDLGVASHTGCRNATHAEANAIAFSARQGTSTEHTTLYVTQSPCLNCARLIIAAGIAEVVYATEYRDTAGIELLEQAGLLVGQVETTL